MLVFNDFRTELMEWWPSLDFIMELLRPSEFCVGFIGYPNIEKSSSINKLLTSKKVWVLDTRRNSTFPR